MKEVGDKFGAGELILPFVLQSAEVMKKSVAHLETYLEKVEGVTKGTVVIATVYGDVHDIGKNLVKTILANNGYTVIDLGKQVPAETIITKAVEVNATAIGLSALLVITSKQMPLIINELQRRGHKIPVLVGGAAINRRFGRRILFTEDGNPYDPGVFYCKDAFEGLETMDQLIDPEAQACIDGTNPQGSGHGNGTHKARTRSSNPPGGAAPSSRSLISLPSDVTLAGKLSRSMPLEMVFQNLNINELYRLSWGAKNTHGPEWEKLQKEFEQASGENEKGSLEDGVAQTAGCLRLFPLPGGWRRP